MITFGKFCLQFLIIRKCIGSSFKRQSIDINPDVLLMGLKGALGDSKLLLTEDEIRGVLQEFQKEQQEKMMKSRSEAEGKNRKEGEEFRFCYVYAPKSRTSLAARRREWRVFTLLAPSLELDPNAENYPFSIKPDQPVTLSDLRSVFSDYYEGTPFDMTKDMVVTDDTGNSVISPLANPHLPYDMNKLFHINGGWGWRGERTIARWYTMYATIIQCRDWLPDEIGGVVWLAQDNVSTSIYIPVYCSVSDLPESYRTPGRPNGYTTESAWWAFNRLGTLTAQRWGEMRYDVNQVWDTWQEELFNNQEEFEDKALQLHRGGKYEELDKTLTGYTLYWGDRVVKKAWEMGDMLWTKYDEKF